MVWGKQVPTYLLTSGRVIIDTAFDGALLYHYDDVVYNACKGNQCRPTQFSRQTRENEQSSLAIDNSQDLLTGKDNAGPSVLGSAELTLRWSVLYVMTSNFHDGKSTASPKLQHPAQPHHVHVMRPAIFTVFDWPYLSLMPLWARDYQEISIRSFFGGFCGL